MRHRKAGNRLKRNSSHRLAMMRNMSTSLFREERIVTTLAKAKAMRPFAEKLITKAKNGGLHNRRLVARILQDETVLKKLFDSLAARYAERQGGYTRILKLDARRGDRAEMAILELVDRETSEAASG